MKACPFCGKSIQDAAIKCRWCRRFLAESVPGCDQSQQRAATSSERSDVGARAGRRPQEQASGTRQEPRGSEGRREAVRSSDPQRPRPGQVLILCPHCGTRFVEVAKKAWFLQGLLLFARYGTKTFVGCTLCVNAALRQNLVTCLLAGWWSFPWGLFTPLVLIQNLLALSIPPPGALHQVLRDAGLDPAEVTVDEHGLTPGLRAFIRSAAAVIAAVVWSDGATSETALRTGARILRSLSDGALGDAEAERLIHEGRGKAPNVEGLGRDERLLLFRIAADAASSDGSLTGNEHRTLFEVGEQLGIPASIVREILGTFYEHVEGARNPQADPEFRRACNILGVTPDARIDEIRSRYRSLMMQYHPDRAAITGMHDQAAHQNAQEINWAYRVILAARSTG
jgi:hypothetical protein